MISRQIAFDAFDGTENLTKSQFAGLAFFSLWNIIISIMILCIEMWIWYLRCEKLFNQFSFISIFKIKEKYIEKCFMK